MFHVLKFRDAGANPEQARHRAGRPVGIGEPLGKFGRWCGLAQHANDGNHATEQNCEQDNPEQQTFHNYLQNCYPSP